MTKKAEIHPHDRLGRLADLAALIEFGLIGLRECNWKPASHGRKRRKASGSFESLAIKTHSNARAV